MNIIKQCMKMPSKTINQLLTNLHSVKVEFDDEELLNAMFERACQEMEDKGLNPVEKYKQIKPYIIDHLKRAYEVAREVYDEYDCRVQLDITTMI
jgi:hypothetical protein